MNVVRQSMWLVLWCVMSCGLVGCEKPAEQEKPVATEQNAEILIYSGRKETFVKPLLKAYSETTTDRIKVKYFPSSQALVQTIADEGASSQADLVWAQDAMSIGQLEKMASLAALDQAIQQKVSKPYQTKHAWVALSGRARVLAYSPKRVTEDQLPQTIMALTDPKWKGRVGWAPTNSSFRAFVGGMRHALGDEKTKAWLMAMKANGAKSYAKNTPILDAIAAGEIDLGLPNHYYLFRFLNKDPNFPVAQRLFQAGDIGNMVNVTGIGQLKTSKKKEASARLINFLLSEKAQKLVADHNYELPVIEAVNAHQTVKQLGDVAGAKPDVDLSELGDLKATDALIEAVGI